MGNPWYYLSRAQRALWGWDLESANYNIQIAKGYFNELRNTRVKSVLNYKDRNIEIPKEKEDRQIKILEQLNRKIISEERSGFNVKTKSSETPEAKDSNRIETAGYSEVSSRAIRGNIEALDDLDAGIRTCDFIAHCIENKFNKIKGYTNLGSIINAYDEENDLRLVAVISIHNYKIAIRGYSIREDVEYFNNLSKKLKQVEVDGNIYKRQVEIGGNIYKCNISNDASKLILSLYYYEHIIKIMCINKPWFSITASIDAGFEDGDTLRYIAENGIKLIQNALI